MIESGDTLRQVAQKEGISASLIIWNARHDETFAKQYARALETRTLLDFEALEDDLRDPERGKFGIDAAWVAWKRLQIDTRKWALSKRNPKVYGDKITHQGDSDAPIELVVRRIGPKE